MEIREKELRKRFVSDYNLPIQVIHEPYFEQRIELFNDKFGSLDKWCELKKLIESKFNNNSSLFLEEYHKIRNNIIETVSYSESFSKFIQDDKLNAQFAVKEAFPDRNLYTNEQCVKNNLFVSIDIKKANYQSLRYYDKSIVLNTDSYSDFVRKFTDLEYVIDSKYTRQVVFGKLNPKRTIFIEKYIINQIINLDSFKDTFLNKFDIFSVNCDEIILKIKSGCEDDFFGFDNNVLNGVATDVKNILDIDVRIEKFKLLLHEFKLGFSDSTVRLFEKDNLNQNKINEWKNIPSIYYPQIYKLMNNLEIKDDDLVFYDNHELVKFLKPLRKYE